MTLKKYFFLALYYGIAYHLPSKTFRFGGGISRKFRYWCCKHLFKKIGKVANIERHAFFGSGSKIEMGNYSSLGLNCHIPYDTIIGDYVMMGPNYYIFAEQHNTGRTDIPMVKQGNTKPKQTIIGNDIWIGRDVMMSPGRHIADGSIIAMRCVLTKDFPPYSVVGGCPCRLLKRRKEIDDSHENWNINTSSGN